MSPHNHIPLRAHDLERYREDLEKTLDIKLREFQWEGIRTQLLRHDAIIHAGTGMGKTMVAVGPLRHPLAQGKIIIMISPLIALQNEQVESFRVCGVKALPINSSHGGCTAETLETLKEGEFQIVLLSPEILLSKKFVESVLRDKRFTERVFSVIVDEAHVISHWGAEFRKTYGEIGTIRPFLPKDTPFIAMSATLPIRTQREITRALQMPKNHLLIDVGNDRPNVSLVVRAIHGIQTSYIDLNFIIPNSAKTVDDIPLTMVYADSITSSVVLHDHFEALLPQHLQSLGLIRPFSALFSVKYRARVMELFRSGRIRVLICTDAAGMGCNLPNVEVVVQWKLPSSVSSFVQRAGRAARGPGRVGLAVMLVEKAAYTEDPLEPAKSSKSATKAATSTKKTKKHGADYAAAHGANRGTHHGENDAFPPSVYAEPPPTAFEHKNEGLFVLVQSRTCRREILRKIYQGKRPSQGNEQTHHVAGLCCDVCEPALLDRVRPGASESRTAQTTIRRHPVVSIALRTGLRTWRKDVYMRDFPSGMFGSAGLLSDDLVDQLASVSLKKTEAHLHSLMARLWGWYPTYGDELCQLLIDLAAVEDEKPVSERQIAKIAPAPKKTASRATKAQREGGEIGNELQPIENRLKRGCGDLDEGDSSEKGGVTKRSTIQPSSPMCGPTLSTPTGSTISRRPPRTPAPRRTPSTTTLTTQSTPQSQPLPSPYPNTVHTPSPYHPYLMPYYSPYAFPMPYMIMGNVPGYQIYPHAAASTSSSGGQRTQNSDVVEAESGAKEMDG